jgi:hypothetical protein
LNTYNIFFAIQQQKLLLQQRTAHGSLKHVKGGFDDFAWTISERWRKLDVAYKTKLENLASMDKDRHDREMKAWKAMKNLTGQDLNSTTKSRDWRVKIGMANELTARIKEIAQQEASEEFIEIHGNLHNDFPTHQQSEQDLMLANMLIHLSENPYDFTECQQNKQESQYCELDSAAKIAGDVMAAVNLRFRYGPSENAAEAGDNSSDCKLSKKQDPILLKGSNKDKMKSSSEKDAAYLRWNVAMHKLHVMPYQQLPRGFDAIPIITQSRNLNLLQSVEHQKMQQRPIKCKRNLLLLARIRRRHPHWPRKREREDMIGTVVISSY